MPDVTGRAFGRLTVVANAGQKDHKAVNCVCACGAVKQIRIERLLRGATKSCGCLRSSALGMHDSRTHKTWDSMIQRCTNPKNRSYERYGARGITVCDRWRQSFAAFFEDMGERPEGKTLDRIDGTRGYEPGNCRWATPAEQIHNSKASVLTPDQVREIRVRLAANEQQKSIAESFGVSASTISMIARGRKWLSVA